MIKDIQSLRAAVIDARKRTQDNRIGTEVIAGRVNIVSVSFTGRGVSSVVTLAAGLSVAEAIRFLSSLR